MSGIAVSRPSPHEFLAALRVFVGGGSGPEHEDQIARCRVALTEGENDPDGFFIARDPNNRITGAVLVQAMPGALGVAWPARDESAAGEDALISTACDYLRDRSIKVCQAFAAANERPAMESLERRGFVLTTELVFLRSEFSADSSGELESPIRCTAVDIAAVHDFDHVLLETHAGTLDCPELNAMRTPDEIVAGFSPGSAERCPWWHTIVEGDHPVGVLLFDRGPAPEVLEMSYLGLIPSARGRGLGRAALARARTLASAAGYRGLSVCVDARNLPALRLYCRHGFMETERRDVYLAQLCMLK